MQERLKNVIKWFFISLGVIFLTVLLITIGLFVGFSDFMNNDFNVVGNAQNKLKNLKPIINYAQNYYDKYGKYPKSIQNVKIKKGVQYEYITSDDNSCYTIKTKTKNSINQQYQRCAVKSDNSNSKSESYIEFSD